MDYMFDVDDDDSYIDDVFSLEEDAQDNSKPQ